MNHCVIETPAGRLCIWEIRECITECAWVNAPLRAPETPLLTAAAREVEEYFKRQRRSFDLPVAAPGTELERAVWQAVLAVPYGRTRDGGGARKEAGHGEENARRDQRVQ